MILNIPVPTNPLSVQKRASEKLNNFFNYDIIDGKVAANLVLTFPIEKRAAAEQSKKKFFINFARTGLQKFLWRAEEINLMRLARLFLQVLIFVLQNL